MSFNRRSRLDPSQVQDRRGRRTGTAIALGGGGLGVIITIVYLLLGGNLSDITGTGTGAQDPYATEYAGVDLQAECQTGQTQTPARTAAS